jgi:protein-tyrosine phosphatase
VNNSLYRGAQPSKEGFRELVDGFKAPGPEEISRPIGMLENKSRGPIFIHCRRGADRTGTVVALYRIEHDH